MKILKKMGLIFTSVILSIKVLATKVYAVAINDIPVQCDYGVQLKPESSIATNIVSTIIVPIILLIGLIVFFVKSTSSVAKKIIVSIGVVGAYIIFRVIMNFIFNLKG